MIDAVRTAEWTYRVQSLYERLFDPRFGFLLLAGAPLVLTAFSVLGSVQHGRSPVATAGLLVVAAGLVAGLWAEWDRFARGSDPDVVGVLEGSRLVAAVVVGSVSTLAVIAEFGLSSIVAAGAIAVVGAFVVPNYAVAVYCGAFVGMTSPQLFTSYEQALLAGVLAGGAFVLCRPVFDGVGGKLGTTAFIAATAVVATTAAEFHSDPLPDPTTIGLILAYSVVGAVVTFVISVRFDRGPVIASGSVGVLGGAALPIVHPTEGALLAAAVFCASFVGMTSPKRLAGTADIAVAGGIAGLIFVYTTPYVGGSGGKLGTIAFGACLTVWGLRRKWRARDRRLLK